MILDVKPFLGQHCETTATGTLLAQLGFDLSEPMLFGLGEGLGFVYWKTKAWDFPFLGGRIKPDELTANLARNLGLQLEVRETSSTTRAWSGVKALVDNGRSVGLKLDSYHLEYFSQPVHFAGHYVAVIGYDDHRAHLVDTVQQGSQVTTSLDSLARARNEKGPMSSRNLFYTLDLSPDRRTESLEGPYLELAVRAALVNNAASYLSPPITNLGYKGIARTATEIICWFDRSDDVANQFAQCALLMERAGTGGALFRNLYRDFLTEAAALTGDPNVEAAAKRFVAIAERWTEVIGLFDQVAKTGQRANIEEAAALLRDLSTNEYEAMSMLVK